MNEPLEKMKKDILINEAIIKKKIDELKIKKMKVLDKKLDTLTKSRDKK